MATMLHRSISRAATRPMLSRGYATGIRPSAVALGKRPLLHSPHLPAGLSLGSSRHLSWTPWKSTPTSSPVDAPSGVSTDLRNPELATPHPDLQTLPPTSSSSHLPTSTSTPISDSIPLTSAPSDPTPLLPQPPALPDVPTLEDLVTKSGMSLSEILHSNEAIHSAIQMSDLKLVGLQHGMLSLSGWVTDALVGMHLTTGLPWWGSIAALTLCIRLCLFPLIIRTLKHNVRLAAVQPQMTALFKRLTEAKAAGDPAAQQVVAKNLTTLMKDNDVSPFRPLLMPLVQMPFFLAMFSALRHLANLPLPQLKEGGFGWVTDLTVSDPYFILPITSAFFTNMVLKVGADGTGAMNNANPNMGHFRNAIQLGLLVSIPFIGRMPAAVLFYWTFTNLFTLLQAVFLRQPAIKRFFNIPTPPPQPPAPDAAKINPNPSYKDTWQALRTHLKDRMELARKEAEAKMEQQERAGGLRKGTAMMKEKIQERPVVSSSTSTSTSTGAPVASAAASTAEEASVDESKLSREEQKARRVAAARERRSRH